MSTTSFYSAPALPSRPVTCGKNAARKRVSFPAISAIRRESDYHGQDNSNGRIVDENMIVLRKRIHEMKMIERNYEPPTEWMDWEKNLYADYDSIICEAMGVLQSHLMNSRPSLALGMMALVAFSVPTTSFLVLFHLMEFSSGVLAGPWLHIG